MKTETLYLCPVHKHSRTYKDSTLRTWHHPTDWAAKMGVGYNIRIVDGRPHYICGPSADWGGAYAWSLQGQLLLTFLK